MADVAYIRAVPVTAAQLDRTTLEAARDGQAWAQHAVLKHFERPVWAIVCRVLGRAGRHGQADDVAQDALLGVLRGLPRYDVDHPAAVSTWVLTIATRTALTALRRNARERVRFDDELVAATDERAPHCVGDDRPDRVAERREAASAIADAVEHLSPEIRAAFVLRAYHDLEYDEIARILEIELGTVKSRLWRARAALQQRLSEVRRDR
ncbi:MAG: sigma-70 family RNA polymerase sigma factor [Deltaproteobacteria bacterium]|nr:sigma-70 family RNA polymerase sigma factor [Deltaproteobacteria bacterium]MBK8239728.1 sigma-70 family RNA polymerase sigma factor [Deltaproteobacteria bacterium]MBK8714463.1 sigma-70 family RNA polymerase sigma factor [Deltaproteobacteria bacterium]MBP7288223.1 sigma-70 family RNA polymerase sigma factor [Nannocystaceae bacterium]